MLSLTVAEMLERYAKQVVELPGVSRSNPHAFAEAKSELAGDMRAEAKRLRTMAMPRAPARPVREIGTGVRDIGRRAIPVVTRARRA